MKFTLLCVLISYMQLTHGNWLTDWAEPVKAKLLGSTRPNVELEPNLAELLTPVPEDNQFSLLSEQIGKEFNLFDTQARNFDQMEPRTSKQTLKEKVMQTLDNARRLADLLRKQIVATEAKETLLKDAIVNGRSGVTVVKITGLKQLPRTYLIRDGRWSTCDGTIQYPIERSERGYLSRYVETPTCAGQEIPANRDLCAFNSVIKYETIPVTRNEEYVEDEFLCLKYTSNSVQRFLSVPRRIVNDTCSNGVVKTLREANSQCGERTVSEYTYYPPSSAAALPLEYCKQRVCRLIVAWHVTSDNVENLASFSHVDKFNKLFNSGSDMLFEL